MPTDNQGDARAHSSRPFSSAKEGTTNHLLFAPKSGRAPDVGLESWGNLCYNIIGSSFSSFLRSRPHPEADPCWQQRARNGLSRCSYKDYNLAAHQTPPSSLSGGIPGERFPLAVSRELGIISRLCTQAHYKGQSSTPTHLDHFTFPPTSSPDSLNLPLDRLSPVPLASARTRLSALT